MILPNLDNREIRISSFFSWFTWVSLLIGTAMGILIDLLIGMPLNGIVSISEEPIYLRNIWVCGLSCVILTTLIGLLLINGKKLKGLKRKMVIFYRTIIKL